VRSCGGLLAAAAIVVALEACGPQPAPSPVPSPGDASPAPSATAVSAAASVTPGGRLAASGSIVVLGDDGSISTIDAERRSLLLAPPDEGIVAFPAWSPDGMRIAAIRSAAEGDAIVVFDAGREAVARGAEPVEIFQSSVADPFYLSWTPDGRNVSFLASTAEGLSLLLAPADGAGQSSTIGSGNPLYFDWIERDRLLAHIGNGPEALLGEIGLDGDAVAPTVDSPGDFRSAIVSPDHRYIGFVRLGVDTASEVVVAARDGTSEHAMPVLGIAAVTFDPTGDTLASIGRVDPAELAFAVPIGPLRLLDAHSGAVRTLLDGYVVSFWWSPDGQTIAALRVQPVDDQGGTGSPVPSPGEPAQEIRLLFVDVASGDIVSETAVLPGGLFVDQLLTYFDQYALSHRLWAPDSSSLLMPVVEEDGKTRVAVMFANGDPPASIDGIIGFWSP
jgi:TolB protein